MLSEPRPVAWALVLALALALAPAVAAEPIVVEPTGDAEAEWLAVSATGDASSGGFAASVAGDAESTCRTFGTVPCATVSLLGATGGSRTTVAGDPAAVCAYHGFGPRVCPVNATGPADGPVALTQSGSASGWYAAASTSGDAQAGQVAATQGGTARATWVAFALDGEAEALVAVSPCGDARGLVAVEGGEATSGACGASRERG